MTLEQIAQQAMDYLDSVGVAADYDIVQTSHLDSRKLNIILPDRELIFIEPVNKDYLLYARDRLRMLYPQKSPA